MTPLEQARRKLSAERNGSHHDDDDIEAAEIDLEITANPWPGPVGPKALIGIAGDLVRSIAPHTEADPMAILFQFLVGFGSLVGRNAFFQVEASRHYPNLFAVLVGRSSRARKGTSWQRVLQILERGGDSHWAIHRIVSGLSSGEGLIWEVRDRITKRQKEEEIEVDAGVVDKRILVVEEEFNNVLIMGKREGNTLSTILRNAWDSGRLRSLTKNSPARSTDAHISAIGHITKRELMANIQQVDAHNGYLNRFLWVCVRRSQLLPNGGGAFDINDLAARVEDAFKFGRVPYRQLVMTSDANELWIEEYHRLTQERNGLFGLVTSRAEAQTIRIALVYALLDKSEVIDFEHLQAAMAIQDYVERSAIHIFGDSLGNSLADEIRALLKSNPDGVTQKQIIVHFGKNKNKLELASALSQLVEGGFAMAEKIEKKGPGRKTTLWKLLEPKDKN